MHLGRGILVEASWERSLEESICEEKIRMQVEQIISDHLGSSGMIKAHKGSVGAILRLFEIIANHFGKDHLG